VTSDMATLRQTARLLAEGVIMLNYLTLGPGDFWGPGLSRACPVAVLP
jgi:hypothetical protein